jgi:predicted Zn finger-like uncharacterized protein
MNIEITCPECKFSRSVPEDKIPAKVKWVVCPGCRHRFEFTRAIPGATDSQKASPWERRTEIGLWKGIYETLVAALFSPGEFFRGRIAKKGIREPLAFGLLMGSLGYIMAFFWDFILLSSGIMPYSSYVSDQIPVNALFLILMILSPVLVAVNIFFTAAVIHLLGLVFNGEKGGFEGSFRVVAFGQSTGALALIPVIGLFIGWCWNLVIVITGLRETHGTSYFRAIAVVVASIFLKWLLPSYLLGTILESLGLLS